MSYLFTFERVSFQCKQCTIFFFLPQHTSLCQKIFVFVYIGEVSTVLIFDNHSTLYQTISQIFGIRRF